MEKEGEEPFNYILNSSHQRNWMYSVESLHNIQNNKTKKYKSLIAKFLKDKESQTEDSVVLSM